MYPGETVNLVTDVRWAVPEFCSIRFAERQEFYGLAVHEDNVLGIDATARSVVSSQMNVNMAFSPFLDLGPESGRAMAHVYPFPRAGVHAMAVI